MTQVGLTYCCCFFCPCCFGCTHVLEMMNSPVVVFIVVVVVVVVGVVTQVVCVW